LLQSIKKYKKDPKTHFQKDQKGNQDTKNLYAEYKTVGKQGNIYEKKVKHKELRHLLMKGKSFF